jgi:putative endonuclease
MGLAPAFPPNRHSERSEESLIKPSFCLLPSGIFSAQASTMAADRTFFVYILAGKSGVLYTGITNHLPRRVSEHKEKKMPAFTQKYSVTRLVWFELYGTALSAIAREKEIKCWRRSKKIALIQTKNPDWRDLSASIN